MPRARARRLLRPFRIPLLQKILKADPEDLHALLYLATSYSQLGRDADAVATFARAEAIALGSEDVRTFLGVHYARISEGARRKRSCRLPHDEAVADDESRFLSRDRSRRE